MKMCPSEESSLLFSHKEKKPPWKPRAKGRPKLQLDERYIMKLAKEQNTVASIAKVMECDDQTLTANYMELIERGWEEGKVDLRSYQWKSAENGSTRMQEWLGINVLGQKSRIEDENKPTSFNINILQVPTTEAAKAIDAKSEPKISGSKSTRNKTINDRSSKP